MFVQHKQMLRKFNTPDRSRLISFALYLYSELEELGLTLINLEKLSPSSTNSLRQNGYLSCFYEQEACQRRQEKESQCENEGVELVGFEDFFRFGGNKIEKMGKKNVIRSEDYYLFKDRRFQY